MKIFYRTNEATGLNKSYQQFLKSLETAVNAKLNNKELSPNARNFFLTMNDLLESKSVIEGTGLSIEVKELLSDAVRHTEVLNDITSKLSSSGERNLETISSFK